MQLERKDIGVLYSGGDSAAAREGSIDWSAVGALTRERGWPDYELAWLRVSG